MIERKNLQVKIKQRSENLALAKGLHIQIPSMHMRSNGEPAVTQHGQCSNGKPACSCRCGLWNFQMHKPIAMRLLRKHEASVSHDFALRKKMKETMTFIAKSKDGSNSTFRTADGVPRERQKCKMLQMAKQTLDLNSQPDKHAYKRNH